MNTKRKIDLRIEMLPSYYSEPRDFDGFKFMPEIVRSCEDHLFPEFQPITLKRPEK